MTDIVRLAAFLASHSLSSIRPGLKRSHLSEVCAALLGYNTLAALQAEEADDRLKLHLCDAEFLVVDLARGRNRAAGLLRSLSPQGVDDVVCTCAASIKAESKSARVYVGLDEFWDSFLRDAMADAVSSSDSVADAMASSNAIFSDEASLSVIERSVEDLWSAREVWSITAQVTLTGELSEDRLYSGHLMNCEVKGIFVKAGRSGLVDMDLDAFAGVDDSWREQARDFEEFHQEFLRNTPETMRQGERWLAEGRFLEALQSALMTLEGGYSGGRELVNELRQAMGPHPFSFFNLVNFELTPPCRELMFKHFPSLKPMSAEESAKASILGDLRRV